MNQIDTLADLSLDDFEKKYFARNQPFIHKGAVLEAGYFKNWSVEYLGSTLGTRRVKVNQTDDGVFGFNKNLIQQVELPLNEALDLFSLRKATGQTHYLQQASIEDNFPELLLDLEMPIWILPSDAIHQINLWIGGAGCVTTLHFDNSNNFLIQVRGRKEITLFSPDDSRYLYPSEKQNTWHLSQIDLDHPDLNQFPLFSHAHPIRFTLEPGDMLFLPPGWWHQVRSLDLCISVNYWWNRFDIPEQSGTGMIDVAQIVQVIQKFLDKGFSINHMTRDGEPVLLKAIKLKFANVTQALLSLGADPNVVSSVYDPGVSALEMARRQGSREIVQLLFKYGAKDGLHDANNLPGTKNAT